VLDKSIAASLDVSVDGVGCDRWDIHGLGPRGPGDGGSQLGLHGGGGVVVDVDIPRFFGVAEEDDFDGEVVPVTLLVQDPGK